MGRSAVARPLLNTLIDAVKNLRLQKRGIAVKEVVSSGARLQGLRMVAEEVLSFIALCLFFATVTVWAVIINGTL
jgi:hypothetical protein